MRELIFLNCVKKYQGPTRMMDVKEPSCATSKTIKAE